MWSACRLRGWRRSAPGPFLGVHLNKVQKESLFVRVLGPGLIPETPHTTEVLSDHLQLQPLSKVPDP